MTDIIISCAVALLMSAVGAFIIKYNALKNEKSAKVFLPKNAKQTLFAIGMVGTALGTAICLNLVYGDDWIFVSKRLILCAVLWPIALVDYRKHIIPNKILLLLLSFRAVMLIPEFIIDAQAFKVEVVSDAIACTAILVVLCLMRLVVKDGIGFGDIKLFGVMGLYLGIEGSITAVFISFVVSFFVSLFLLVSKRKSKKDQVAFAPSILIGAIISIVFFGA